SLSLRTHCVPLGVAKGGGSQRIHARRKVGRPTARPQSLANTIDCESNAQAGSQLLHAPSVNAWLPVPSDRCTQICRGPDSSCVQATQRPSGDRTGSRRRISTLCPLSRI